MAVTLHNYDHNAYRFATGANSASDTYKVILLSASASFGASHTTTSQVTNSGAWEVSGNGWASGGVALSNVTLTLSNTDEATFDANDVSVLISGGSLQYRNYVLVNATDNAPVLFFALSEDAVFAEDSYGGIVWPADGIYVIRPV